MENHDFVELRRNSIGGSDAAAIVGLSPYSSKYRVWAEKLGRVAQRKDSEAMRQGRDLEEYVAQRFEEATGKKTTPGVAFLINPEYPFAHANTDRGIEGEDAGLECKTTSVLNLKRFKGGEYPAEYYAQCVHYMAVTGARYWYLAVLVLGKAFYHYRIDRDEAEIEWLMNEERTLWNDYIMTGIEPPGDGSKADTEAISEIYSEVTPDVALALPQSYEERLREYMVLKGVINDNERRLEEIKQSLMLAMKDIDEARTYGFAVTWRKQSRSTLNEAELLKAYPDIDISKCKKVSSFRVFTVKEAKKNGG